MSLNCNQQSVLRAVKQTFYNVWCFLCLYALGAWYTLIELNRKYELLTKVRKLDIDKDIPTDLTGNICIITGGSRGIGWEAAKVLLQKGCHVIIASSVEGGAIRSLEQKLNDDAKSYKGRLEVWHLNLSSMASVKQFVNKFDASGYHLNVLINNAGQMFAPYKLTEDKIESHWAINYLAHCLLVALLLPTLEKTGSKFGTKSRVINVASSTHFARNMNFNDLNGDNLYSPFHAYAQSKLAQIMFTYKLHTVLTASNSFSNVRALTLHPGVAKTELYEHVWWVVAFPYIANQLFRVSIKLLTLIISH